MSYEAIPPERQAAFLQNAQAAVESAVEPVVSPAIEALGSIAASEAEAAHVVDAKKGQVSAGADTYLASQQSVGDEADKFLQDREEGFQTHVAEVTGEQPDSAKALAAKLAAQAAGFDVMSQSAAKMPDDAYDPLEGLFDKPQQPPTPNPLQDKLWDTMAEQQRQEPNPGTASGSQSPKA